MVRLERLVSTLLVNNMSSALSGTKWLISGLEQFPIQLLTCVQTLITVPTSSATEDFFFFFLSFPYHTKQGNSIIGLSILDNEGCQCRSWLPRFNYSGPKLLLSSSWCTLVLCIHFVLEGEEVEDWALGGRMSMSFTWKFVLWQQSLE